MFGIGLRPVHYPYLEQRPQTELDWFEAISENYMDSEGRPIKMLELIRADYPVALHGVGLSIASSLPLDVDYLKSLKKLVSRVEPFLVSDHLCFTGGASHSVHDLLPFPMHGPSLERVCERVMRVQEYLGRQILLENVSSYVRFAASTYDEASFLNEICRQTGCRVLLDLNNVYVNAVNHGFDPHSIFTALNPEVVGQIHLAGHVDTGVILYDTHSTPVCSDVWKLFERATSWLPGSVPVLVEWDADIPDFQRVESEVLRARALTSAASSFKAATKPLEGSYERF